MTRFIGVVSGKGGVGKTTIVANLGAVLASEFGCNTVVVDCNITTSHLGLHMGINHVPVSLNHVLRGEHNISDAMYEHESSVKIIPASLAVKDLSGLDIINLRKYMQGLFGKADVVLLDSAPGLGREAMATLQASDEILFVTTPYITSVMDILRCREITNDFEHLGGLAHLGIVLNMSANKRHEMKKADIEKLTEMPVLASIPSDKKILQSLALRTPLVTRKPNSKTSEEFRKLGASILRQDYKPRSGLFRWFR